MIKTLRNIGKQDKEKFVVPKGVQDVIPVTAIYDDGIFQIGKDKFSKSFKFTDINYAVASREDKEEMFLEYSELLNSFDSGATTKITINNRRLNRLDFEKSILIPLKDDALDIYRDEYNKMLLDKATGANSMVQDKYITVSVCKKNIEEARTYFNRVGNDMITHLSKLGSQCIELEAEERLRIFHDFYRVGEESSYHFSIKESCKKGHSFKDYICPDSMEFEKDFFKIGDRYGRVLFMRDYASYIKDSMISELTELNRNLILSIDVIPVPTDEAKKELINVLGSNLLFDTPKPSRLIERVLQIASDKDSIILDSFAGSGTTAHAVLNMNKADGGNRKFILIEMMDYAESITAERVRRVINGYGEGKKAVEGTGSDFSYYELGEPIFNGDMLNEEIGEAEIRKYVYFTETKQTLAPHKSDEPYYLGTYIDNAYYFYYEKKQITTLNNEFLNTIKSKAGAYVIYADLCTLSNNELEKYRITFKKIPRDISKL